MIFQNEYFIFEAKLINLHIEKKRNVIIESLVHFLI